MQIAMPETIVIGSHRVRNAVRWSIGLITGLVGIADMISALVPKLHWDILLGAWTIHVHPGVRALTVIVGFFLIMLSYGLGRGKHQAWRIALLLLFLSALLHILRGGLVLTTIIALVLLLVLFCLAPFFRARSDPPSARRGYLALLLALGTVTFYTVGGFLVLYKDFEPLIDRFGIDGVVLRIMTHAHLSLHGTQAFFFERALPILCLSAVLYGMIQILRPVAATLLTYEKEKPIAAALTRTYGKNSISYFTLGDDKSYFFSASGKAVISYVLTGSVAVVAGDPIGPDEEVLPAIQQFMAFCHEQDWTSVFWQVCETYVDLYRKASLRLLKIGEDAVIHPQTFTLKGSARANIRASAKRAQKDGIHTIFYRGQVEDSEHLAQMEQITHEWLACKGGSEMGFSMSRFDTHPEQEHIYALALDPTNTVQAFVTFVPIYGRHGWALDLMRRAENTVPGTMELLLVHAIDYLKNQGAQVVSLGLAPLSNANNDNENFLDNSIDFLTNLFGNGNKRQSLCRFKKKFQPSWESRYLVFSNTLTLPKIGWALYQAHQQDASLFSLSRRLFIEWRNNYRAAKQSENVSTGALKVLEA